MSSSELIALRKQYINFRTSIGNIIDENTNALNNIEGSDGIIAEAYSVGDNSIDNGYIKESIDTISATRISFKSILRQVENEIDELSHKIEIAQDRELAERIALSGK